MSLKTPRVGRTCAASVGSLGQQVGSATAIPRPLADRTATRSRAAYFRSPPRVGAMSTRISNAECLLQEVPQLRSDAQVVNELTEREHTVLELMAEGRSNAGIAEELCVTIKTVESHAAAVFLKLGLFACSQNNRRVMAVLAYLRGRAA